MEQEFPSKETRSLDLGKTPAPCAQSSSSDEEEGSAQGGVLPSGPANGDWKAWLQCFGSFLLLFNAWGLLILFGALQPHYQFSLLQLHSASSITWIGGLQSFLLVSAGIVTGPIYDMGHQKTLIVTGGVLTVFGMMMLSLCTEYYQIILTQGLCIGLGAGLVNVPSTAMVAESFSADSRPVALALVNSGISVGGVSYLLTFQHLIVPLGFAWTIRTMAFLSLGTFMLGTPLLLCRRVVVANGQGRTRRSLVDRSAWTDVPFLTLCVGGFFRYLGYFSPIFFLPLFAQTSLGLPPTKAIDLLMIFSGSSFFGRLLGSYIVQRSARVMIPWLVSLSGAGIICLAWPAVNTWGGAVTFAVLYGFFSGPLNVFNPVVIPNFCPSMAQYATRMGMAWLAASFAFLIGSPIGARVADPEHGRFLGLQLFCGFSLLCGAAMLLPLWGIVQKKQ